MRAATKSRVYEISTVQGWGCHPKPRLVRLVFYKPQRPESRTEFEYIHCLLKLSYVTEVTHHRQMPLTEELSKYKKVGSTVSSEALVMSLKKVIVNETALSKSSVLAFS